MKIIWDASNLGMYPLAQPGFRGGTETMIAEIAKGLASRGHSVHVVAHDAQQEEQRGPNEFWWPVSYHPRIADAVVLTNHITDQAISKYNSPLLIVAQTGADPMGDGIEQVDAWPVFCEKHGELLRMQRPMITKEKCFVTGLGIEIKDYNIEDKGGYANGIGWYGAIAPGRMLYANDPMRGLFYVLDVFALVQKAVPTATLHIAYDFNRQAANHWWKHSYEGQLMHECASKINSMPGVISLGALTKEQLIQEQLECQVHCMPSDPPNIGTQTWGITQMECAAAGSAIVLSDVEAFPEVFSDGAYILPVIGKFDGTRRFDAQDYADVVIDLMQDNKKWQEASMRARQLAQQHTWDKVIDRWEAMLLALVTPLCEASHE